MALNKPQDNNIQSCLIPYKNSMNGHSLFSNMVGDLVVFLVVYVDDILVTVMNTKEIQSLRIFFNAQFKIKDLGDLHYFLIMKLLENQMVFF